MEKENPINDIDKVVDRLAPEVETDDFSPEDQKEIVKMVIQDFEADRTKMARWIELRKKDVQMYQGDLPSKIENLQKKAWMSDRNLGTTASVCDIYQAVLLATCFNVDTLHFRSEQDGDQNNKDNMEKFARWALGPSESGVFNDIDAFIHNRVTQGSSFFEILWDVWYEWVDRRMPKDEGGYTIKTEEMRFERGNIENIDNIEDIFFDTDEGDNIEKFSHIGRVLHMRSSDLLADSNRNVFTNVDDDVIKKLKRAYYEHKVNEVGKEKAEQLGLLTAENVTDVDLRNFPIDVLRWYGYFKRNGKTERFRFYVEPSMKLFLAGKPLRKITRTNRYPIVGGGLIKEPGFLLGKSIPRLVAPITNQLNNIYNQKADFQYVENCPTGFFNPEEGYTRQEYELIPGVMYPTDGEPSSKVYFPNHSRSMAWAESDIRILLEMLERATGAASYFMSNSKGTSGTATRDVLINEKSDTKFSLWVKRIIEDISRAITIYINYYQDWAPSNLGERVLGEDGKKLFKNLSIETLKGNFSAYLSPDVIAGSKALEKEIALWAFANLQQSPWFNPSINPKGSWNLTVRTAKKVGFADIESMMPPEPKAEMGSSKEVDNEWSRFMQGEEFDPDPKDNVVEHYFGHLKQAQERIQELDEEYRPNFDKHFMKTMVQFHQFMQNQQQQAMANQMANQMIMNKEQGISDEADQILAEKQPAAQPQPTLGDGNGVKRPAIGPRRI